jgi:ribosomal protein S18
MQSSGRRSSPRGGDRRPARGEGPRGPRRIYRAKKVCRFCKNSEIKIDYKDAKALRPFITERGARNLAIVPFTAISMHM